MNTSQIKNEIKKSLQKVHNKNYQTRKEWTKAFKNSLKKLSENEIFENKIKTYPNEEKNEGEWLVDLCWSNEGDDWKTDFKGLKLACEIEWNKDTEDLLYDFMKLTVIDAEIRLFIFQYNSEKEYKNIINKLEKACNFTKIKNYEYLLAGSGNNEENMIFKEI